MVNLGIEFLVKVTLYNRVNVYVNRSLMVYNSNKEENSNDPDPIS